MSEGDDATLPDSRGGSPPRTSSSGDLGDRYEVGPLLGRGGMGEVRLARDLRIDREVAVKLMRSSARDDATMGRFFREARVQGVLEHPAVVPVHDLGIDRDGNPYFVMKRLAGTTLADVLASTDPAMRDHWPRRTLLARFVDVCLAVEFAHTRGVIHRDLKPANLMLGEFGEAYVLDWGLARIAADGDSFRGVAPLSGDDVQHTLAGDLLGTPGYMAPEQARGEVVDVRTDIYALGCVLFEILVGKPALPRGLEALAATLTTPYHQPSQRAPGLPPELDALCVKATAQLASERPSARALADGIQAYLDGDRDLARRRELAEEHAVRARAAFREPGDPARAEAMREAGRALALDPSNVLAQETLGRALLQMPDAIPAEALASADEERGRIRQSSLRKAAWTYLSQVPAAAVLFLFPVRHAWPIIYGMVMAASGFALSLFLARRPMPMRSPWFLLFMWINVGLLATVGLLFGPLLILPMFLIGSLSAFLSQPSRHSTALITGIHLAPLVVMFVLEGLHVLPSSFHVEAHHLVVTPWAIDLTATSAYVIWVVTLLLQLGSTVTIQTVFRRDQEVAQNRVHANAWHLQQLLPRAKPDDTGAPKR